MAADWRVGVSADTGAAADVAAITTDAAVCGSAVTSVTCAGLELDVQAVKPDTTASKTKMIVNFMNADIESLLRVVESNLPRADSFL